MLLLLGTIITSGVEVYTSAVYILVVVTAVGTEG